MLKIKEFLIKNKSFIINFLIAFIILFIILLAFYPGVLTVDGDNQWQQVQSGLITNAHPFFSTYFIYLLSKIWNSVTVVIVFQMALFSICWGFLCQSIKCTKKQEWLKHIFIMLISLFPLTAIYSITLWKDIIYTSYLFCIGTLLFNWAKNNYKLSITQYILLGILLALSFSYRYNGIIVSILILIFMLIMIVNKYKKKIINKENLKKCGLVLISFVLIITLISIPKKIILTNSQKEISKESKDNISLSSVDAYMLWMFGSHITANSIKDKKDLEFLDNIIPIDEWKKSYSPYLINNTNANKYLNKKYIIDNEKEFKDLFIKYALKNPGNIICHYLQSDGLLINPVSMINGYVYVYSFQELNYLPNYAQIKPKLPSVERFYIKLINLTLNKPFIIMYQPAFILYLSIVIAAILAIKVYGKKIWMFCLPMFCNTISLLPINLAQDLRYAYINYLTFFGLLLIFIINYKKVFSRNIQKLKVK